MNKPYDFILLRLPLFKCEVTVTEKHTHRGRKARWLPEWMFFVTADGKEMKVHVATAASIGDEREHLSTFDVGDKGTMYYRKGKKYNYFVKFEHDAESSVQIEA